MDSQFLSLDSGMANDPLESNRSSDCNASRSEVVQEDPTLNFNNTSEQDGDSNDITPGGNTLVDVSSKELEGMPMDPAQAHVINGVTMDTDREGPSEECTHSEKSIEECAHNENECGSVDMEKEREPDRSLPLGRDQEGSRGQRTSSAIVVDFPMMMESAITNNQVETSEGTTSSMVVDIPASTEPAANFVDVGGSRAVSNERVDVT